MTGITEKPDSEPASPSSQSVISAPTASRKIRARTLVIVISALVLVGAAFGIGESAAISARHTLSQARSQLTAARGQLAKARGQLTSTRGQLIVARDELTSADAKVRAAQTAAAHANAKAQAKYAAAEAKLASDTKTLNTLIGRVRASAISADGVYVVGQDIKPGTWHTAGDHSSGGFACYYATLASTNTSDILDNNNFDGPETVNVDGAHAFQISGPCTWYRTGP